MRAPSSGILQELEDTDLIKSHMVAKDSLNSTSNLMAQNATKWLPLIENEINYRKDVISKSKDAVKTEEQIED
jgi:hypothetical protein